MLKTGANLVKGVDLAGTVDSLMKTMAKSSLKKYCGSNTKDVEECIRTKGRNGDTIEDEYRADFVRNLATDDYLVLAKKAGSFSIGFIDLKFELIATAIQLPQLVKMLIKSPCKEVDGALAAFFENAVEGDTTCFRLAVRLQPGCTYLAFAAVLHMIFGALAAHNGNTAVAERVAADPGPTPARRGSDFEPVEAEEAKEGDEDEKKGLSMWENISAQVKGAFPAAEKAEAPEPPAEAEPIHAKTEV